MLRKFLIVLFLVLICSPAFLLNLCAEDVNISTYYPSPYGSYRNLNLDDLGGGVPAQSGSIAIRRSSTNHLGSHIAFLRDGAGDIMGMGYEQSSDTFGFGAGTLGVFTPTLLSIDSFGRVGIGTNTPASRLQAISTDTSANTTTDILRITHNGTAATIPTVDFGTGFVFSGKSSTSNDQDMARIQSTWVSANHATRASNLQFQTKDDGISDLQTHMTLGSSGLDVSSDGGSILIPRKTTSGDPTGTPGMIYYNAYNNKFRMFQNTQWVDMVGGAGTEIIVSRSEVHVIPASNTSWYDGNEIGAEVLQFSVGANETWQFEISLLFHDNASPDPKVRLTGPNLAGGGWISAMMTCLFSNPTLFTIPTAYSTMYLDAWNDVLTADIGGAASYVHQYVFKGVVKTGSTSGFVRLQYGNRVSSPVTQEVLPGSYLIARKLS